MPKGGSRALNTKKRLGSKNLAYQMMDFNQMSGSNADLRTAPYGMFLDATGKPISAFNSASPEVRAQMISAIPKKEKLNYKIPKGPKRQATPAQLAALAKGRATRAEKIRSATNQIVKAATQIVASVNETVAPKKKRGRKPLSEEQKAMNKLMRAEKNKQMRAEKKKSSKEKKD
jgi:hypothetical protein